MKKVSLEIKFTRSIGDDEEVFEQKAIPFDEAHVGPQIKEEIEEFGPTFETFEVQSVEMGEPTPDQYLVFVKAVAEFEGDTPSEVLRNVVDRLQEAYDDGASGFFDILEVDGVSYDPHAVEEPNTNSALTVSP